MEIQAKCSKRIKEKENSDWILRQLNYKFHKDRDLYVLFMSVLVYRRPSGNIC